MKTRATKSEPKFYRIENFITFRTLAKPTLLCLNVSGASCFVLLPVGRTLKVYLLNGADGNCVRIVGAVFLLSLHFLCNHSARWFGK